MTQAPRSDAIVVLGVTGDLAYRKIFPSLYKLTARHRLDVPVIGVVRMGRGPVAAARQRRRCRVRQGTGAERGRAARRYAALRRRRL